MQAISYLHGDQYRVLHIESVSNARVSHVGKLFSVVTVTFCISIYFIMKIIFQEAILTFTRISEDNKRQEWDVSLYVRHSLEAHTHLL
jgi:hypothetical protein